MKCPTNPYLPSCILTPLGKELGDLAGSVFLWIYIYMLKSPPIVSDVFKIELIHDMTSRVSFSKSFFSEFSDLRHWAWNHPNCLELALIFHRKLMAGLFCYSIYIYSIHMYVYVYVYIAAGVSKLLNPHKLIMAMCAGSCCSNMKLRLHKGKFNLIHSTPQRINHWG